MKTPKWLKELLSISNKKHKAERAELESRYKEYMKYQDDRHIKELDETKKAVDKIVERFSRVTIVRSLKENHEYGLHLRFDSHMFGAGYQDKREIELIAERLAMQVKMEVASCRFLQPKNVLDYEDSNYRNV